MSFSHSPRLQCLHRYGHRLNNTSHEKETFTWYTLSGFRISRNYTQKQLPVWIYGSCSCVPLDYSEAFPHNKCTHAEITAQHLVCVLFAGDDRLDETDFILR